MFFISIFTLPALLDEVDDDLLESVAAAFNKSQWLTLLLDLFVEVTPPPLEPPLLNGRRSKSDVEDEVPVCSFFKVLFVCIALCPELLALLLVALW